MPGTPASADPEPAGSHRLPVAVLARTRFFGHLAARLSAVGGPTTKGRHGTASRTRWSSTKRACRVPSRPAPATPGGVAAAEGTPDRTTLAVAGPTEMAGAEDRTRFEWTASVAVQGGEHPRTAGPGRLFTVLLRRGRDDALPRRPLVMVTASEAGIRTRSGPMAVQVAALSGAQHRSRHHAASSTTEATVPVESAA